MQKFKLFLLLNYSFSNMILVEQHEHIVKTFVIFQPT